jgi:D-alanyl-lipoteichoic acid acyltransferase DltB (MBOAT superfamily)
MLFNSLAYLLFFPAVTLLYFLLPHRWRPVHLLLASCFFYAAFVPAYLLVLGFTILIDYAAGLLIAPARGRQRTAWLVLSLAANIGVLAAFKYYNFFAGNVNDLLHALVGRSPALPLLDVLLPIGLSFHTFQAMSYTIEVYRGRQPAERHLGLYALYVLFFPQLVAGPIERPQALLPQFRERHAFRYDDVTHGLRLILWGMFKKVLIADRLALFTDPVFNDPRSHSPVVLLLAAFFFSFQIFCDFSGYSDIAVGSARVMGFRLMQNFDRPYAARTVTGFWTRWHISLSSWLRDYVYIPLGGNRVPPLRWCLNIGVVFLLSGLWHGANWTFVAWGTLHALYVLGEAGANALRARFGIVTRPDRLPRRYGAAQVILTFSLVTFAWIFFRSRSLEDAFYVAGQLLRVPGQVGAWVAAGQPVLGTLPVTPGKLVYCLALVLFLEVLHAAHGERPPFAWLRTKPVYLRWAVYYAFLAAILLAGVFDSRPFIYFQF